MQLLLVGYEEEKKDLEVWTERLDEVAENYCIDPWNEVLERVRCAWRAMMCVMCRVS